MKKVYSSLLATLSFAMLFFVLGSKSLAAPQTMMPKHYYVDEGVEDLQVVSTHRSSGVYHVFSHGRPGQLHIAGMWLDARQVADFLSARVNSLTTQINIYGCEFGKGKEGQDAVAYLERALGVAVNASDDVTGRDGDWLLEVGGSDTEMLVVKYEGNLQCTDSKKFANNCDFDGDGVANQSDLDDDNDGVLDKVEMKCVSNFYLMHKEVTRLDGTTGFTESGENRYTISTSGRLLIDGSTFGANTSKRYAFASPGDDEDAEIGGGVATLRASATADRVNPAMATYKYTSPVHNLEIRIKHLSDDAAGTHEEARITGYSDGRPVIPTATFVGADVLEASGRWYRSTTTTVTSATTVIYTFDKPVDEVVFEAHASGRAETAINGVIISFLSGCDPQDTDADGVPNHLDLDTDGDGCTDATEAGVADAFPDIITTGTVVNKSGNSTKENARVMTSNGGDSEGDANGFHDILEKGSTGTGEYVDTYTYNLANTAGLDNDLDGIVNNCDPDPNDPCVHTYITADQYCEAIKNGATGLGAADCDGDGVTNKNECTPPGGLPPTDPKNPCKFNAADITLPVDPGAQINCACADTTRMAESCDYDGDGKKNSDDLDDDNDGIVDTAETVCGSSSTYDYGLSSCPANPGGALAITSHCTGWYSDFPTTGYNFDFLGVVSGRPRFDLQGSKEPIYGRVAKDMTTCNAGSTYTYSFIAEASTVAWGFYPIVVNRVSYNGYLRAIDAATGKVLAELKLPTGNKGGTYSIDFTALSSTTKITIGYDTTGSTGHSSTLNTTIGGRKSHHAIVIQDGSFGLKGAAENSLCCYKNPDIDHDGIPNHFDLDSDGDGCADAVEGGAGFSTSNLVASTLPGGNRGDGYTGKSKNSVKENLGNVVDANGIPTVADGGQGLGESQVSGPDADADGIPAQCDPSDTDPCQNTYMTRKAFCDAITAGAIGLGSADCDGDGVVNKTECTPPGDHPITDPRNPCDYNKADQTLETTAAWKALDCDKDGNPNDKDPDPKDPCVNTYTTDSLVCAAIRNGADSLGKVDCDGDGVVNKTECTPPSGSPITKPKDPCDYNKGDITVTVTADQSKCKCDVTNPALDCDKDGDPNGKDPKPLDPCVHSYTTKEEACNAIKGGADSLGNKDCDGDGVLGKDECVPPGGGTSTNPLDPCDYTTANQKLTTSAAWKALDCDKDGNPNGGDPDPKNPCVNTYTTKEEACNAIKRGQADSLGKIDCDGDGVLGKNECVPPTPGNPDTDPRIPCDYNASDQTLTPTADLSGCCPAIINSAGANTHPTLCGASDGTISLCGMPVSTSGYTVSYVLNGGAATQLSGQSTNASGCITLSNLVAGSYTKIFVKSSSCAGGSNQLSATLSDPDSPSIGIGAKADPLICGGSDGSFTITGLAPNTKYKLSYYKDGIPQTSFSFTTSSTSYVLSGLTEGLYTGIAVTSNGCKSNAMFAMLSDPTAASITTSATPPSGCQVSDATLTINGLVAGTKYSIMYTKDGISQQTFVHTATSSSYMFKNLNAGDYRVKVRNGDCNSNESGQVISDPGGAVIGVTGTHPTLCDAVDGSFTLTGLTSGLSYTLNYVKDGVQQSPVNFTSSSTSHKVTGLSAGVYSGINVVQGGCKSNTLQVNLVDPDGTQISAVGYAPTSCTANDGRMQIIGLIPGVSYILKYSKDGVSQTDVPFVASGTSHELKNLVASRYSNIRVDQSSCISNSVNVDFTCNPCQLVFTSDTSLCNAVRRDISGLGVCDYDGDGVTNKDECTPPTGGTPTDPTDPCKLNKVDISKPVTSTKRCEEAQLSIVKRGPDSWVAVAAGQEPTYEYSLTVKNTGGLSSSGTITVTDTIDRDLNVLSLVGNGVWSCTQSGSTIVSCTTSQVLAAKDSLSKITIRVSVKNPGKRYFNTAYVHGGGDPDNNTPAKASKSNTVITAAPPTSPDAILNLKVLLQGALFPTQSESAPTNGVMRDDLRDHKVIPSTEPYSALGASNARFKHVNGGGEVLASSLLATEGDNAIVDWVFVELRDSLDGSKVLQTRSALVQRDGDVVDAATGTSLIFKGLANKRFFVSVKHRNHLGAMTALPVRLSATGTTVDFTTMASGDTWNQDGYEGYEQVSVSGRMALWAGNTTVDKQVKYVGLRQDPSPIFSFALSHSGNTLQQYNYDFATPVYENSDVNMDAKTKYRGTSNDPSFIFFNVVTKYVGKNVGSLYNYDLFLEQLP